jgi:ferredoxin
MCVLAAPDIFDQDADDGRVVLLVEQVTVQSRDAAEEAVASCPSGALALLDDAETS